MATEATYTALRENLASYLDRVTDDREVLLVKRRGARDVAIVPQTNLPGFWKKRICCARRRTPSGCSNLCGSLTVARERRLLWRNLAAHRV